MVVFKMLDDIVLPLSVTVRPPSREKMELEAEVVICTGGAAFELTLLGGSLSLFSRSKMPPRLVPVAFDTVDRTSELWEDLVSCAFSRISLLRGVLPEGRVILYLPSCSGKTRRAFDSTFDDTAVVDTVPEEDAVFKECLVIIVAVARFVISLTRESSLVRPFAAIADRGSTRSS